MNIYGVCVVQDECDVIADCLQWASRFCDRIWVWDLGSQDGTWELLETLASDQIRVERLPELRYASALRGDVFNAHRDEMREGSWVYILDADEFLVGDPKPVLEKAEGQGAGLVGVWQANFFPTPADVEQLEAKGEQAWLDTPLSERLRHYRVEWQEWRFVRTSADLVWDAVGHYSRMRTSAGRALKSARHRMVVRHYRYRSPTQVTRRFETRRSGEASERRFGYDVSGNFARYVRPKQKGRLWPPGAAELKVPGWELLRAWFYIRSLRIIRRLQRPR